MTNELNAEKVRALLEGITPGQWRHESGEWRDRIYVADSALQDVTVVGRVRRRDARLVTAAPDLARAYLAQAEEIERLKAALVFYAERHQWFKDESYIFNGEFEERQDGDSDAQRDGGAKARKALEAK